MEERAFEYIDAIAANLGVAAEHVYGTLLKQAMVSGARSLVFIVICLAIGYVVIRLFKRIYADVKSEDTNSIFVDGWHDLSAAGIIASFAGGIVLVIISIAIIADISNASTALLNPEYWALKEILDTIKGAEY